MTIHERPPTSAALRRLIDAPTRAMIEAHVEAVIAFLDRLDGDCDAEPSLAGFSGGGDDREGEDCALEDGGDSEPSLGSPDRMLDQENWAPKAHWTYDAMQDRELDRSDYEPGDNGIADQSGLAEQVQGGVL